MTSDTSGESGIEELIRLSKEIGDMEKELVQDLGRARTKLVQAEKKQALWSVVRDMKVSLVADQLRQVAPREIVETVEAMKKSRDTGELKSVIMALIDELEKRLDSHRATVQGNNGYSSIQSLSTGHLARTLGILTEFLFYIE